ncbi:MAG: hypothetical protein B0A82_10650 [Alkalinema sp. CACIAM 70d]|nr:MAG: hypothetical protein B0A82_10650 [Alkalinema sp. CACIAM 70d]
MTIATHKLTFEEYLTFEDGTDTRYELVNGDLIPMSLGTGLHGEIIWDLTRVLEQEIQRLDLDWVARPALIGVQSPRGGRWDTSRIPDITVLSASQWTEMKGREAVIRLSEAPPSLVVDVVSTSTKADDYGAKWSEYSVLNIPEYWIVDPTDAAITICRLENGRYQDALYRGDSPIVSPTFPGLTLTAVQVLNAGASS